MKETVDLSLISEEDLLNRRICDLPLKIEGTWLAECVHSLYRELENKGISFKPVCYLADEWLTPDKEPVVGIPFFLAHPVLMKLEKKFMLDVEGGTKAWCMKLLRHETGHALNYAYKLYRRKKWQKIFGRFSEEYGDTYRFRPYSKSFVRHLENYYAQYHPDEDFAETFAVWLTPTINWRKKYKGWKALEKLEYVEEVMAEIKQKPPLVPKGKKYWALPSLKIKLKTYYKRKRSMYEEDFPEFHDSNLKRIFKEGPAAGEAVVYAYSLVKKYKKRILDNVSLWSGEKKYIVGDLLDNIIERCRELNLVCTDEETVSVLKISIYLTVLIMNYVHTGRLKREK